MERKLSFEQAKARYVHRFTCEHVPAWATVPAPNGRYYAPQYATDREWYNKTAFKGEPAWLGLTNECTSLKPSWPLGQWLDAPFSRERQYNVA